MTDDVRARLRTELLAMADLPYGGEAVDQLAHALQTATLAADAGARPELVAAALLHDVGRSAPVAAELPGVPHERVAAAHCTRLLGHDVGWLVGSHVLAKRVLVRLEPAYAAALSAVSTRSLAEQGGPAGDVELAAFLRHPLRGEALSLRRWDDAAKVAGAPTRSLDDLLDLALAAPTVR
ncbi:MAG: HD domain-containing protein [Pseudonocardia sp.]